MRAFRMIGIGLLAGAFVAASASAETVKFTANLQASSEVPATTSQGSGVLDATFDTDTRQLKWKATYQGLTGPATAAHFHGPASVGQNASPVVHIAANALPSPIEGSIKLDKEQAAQLMSGKWYFNVHTQANPNGEIRGQVESSS
jgi:hypothetical protein